jgi:hypothetical protein
MGALAGASSTTDANGVATFSGLTITLDGGTTPPYSGTLTYAATGVAGTALSAVSVTAFYQLSIVTRPMVPRKTYSPSNGHSVVDALETWLARNWSRHGVCLHWR